MTDPTTGDAPETPEFGAEIPETHESFLPETPTGGAPAETPEFGAEIPETHVDDPRLPFRTVGVSLQSLVDTGRELYGLTELNTEMGLTDLVAALRQAHAEQPEAVEQASEVQAAPAESPAPPEFREQHPAGQLREGVDIPGGYELPDFAEGDNVQIPGVRQGPIEEEFTQPAQVKWLLNPATGVYFRNEGLLRHRKDFLPIMGEPPVGAVRGT